MCAIQRLNGQDKRFKCLFTGYGSRCQAHRFVSRTATLLGFSSSIVSHVYQEWSTTPRTSSQLDITVGSIGVNMGQHPCGMLSTPYRVHALTNVGSSEVFLIFGIVSSLAQGPYPQSVSLMLSAKKRLIRSHFYSLWYDSARD